METQDRHATLKAVGQFISFIGWAVVAISVIAAVWLAKTMGAYAVIVALLGSIQGILIVALGQVIQCLVDIERNTESSGRFLRLIAAALAPGMNPKESGAEHRSKQVQLPENEECQTVCDACGETFEGNLSGQSCPNCGAMLTEGDEPVPQNQIKCAICNATFARSMSGKPCPECGATL